MIRLVNSIARELVKLYPKAPVYVQKIPKEFERPSFFIQYVAGDTDELNKTMRQDNYSFQVVYFGEFSDNDVPNVDKQFGEVERIKRPFKKGFLEVETTDRKAKVTGLRSDLRDDEIYIDIDLYIIDLEPLTDKDFDQETYDLMGEIVTDIDEI